MRIAVLAPRGHSPAPLEAAAMLADQGHDVAAVVAAGTRLPTRRQPRLEVTVAEDPTLADAAADGQFLRRQWRYDPPDVVHAFGLPGAVAAHAASAHQVPVVVSLGTVGAAHAQREAPSAGAALGRVRLERQLLTQAAHVIAGCAEHALEILRLGVPAERLSVLPMAVDSQTYRSPHAAPRDPLVRVITLDGCRDATGSGVTALVEALAMTPGVALTVAGAVHPDVLSRLWRAARRLHLTGRLRIVGAQRARDVPRLLSEHHALVTAAPDQPWGRVTLEALACARPVVALGVGASHEFVVDDTNGYVAPSADAHGLADALVRLRDHEIERPGTLGAACRAGVVRKHAWAARASALVSSYAHAREAGVPAWEPVGVGVA